MKIEMRKVTWYSKALAMAIFVVVPFIAFWLGVQYAELRFAAQQEPVVPEGGAPVSVVGGDKDIHGCIGSAGYSWCGTKAKCLRVWEEPCEVTSDACTATGGSIVDTLGAEGGSCPVGQENLGSVTGVRCPCICCK
jgi:hypothetical protein